MHASTVTEFLDGAVCMFGNCWADTWSPVSNAASGAVVYGMDSGLIFKLFIASHRIEFKL